MRPGEASLGHAILAGLFLGATWLAGVTVLVCKKVASVPQLVFLLCIIAHSCLLLGLCHRGAALIAQISRDRTLLLVHKFAPQYNVFETWRTGRGLLGSVAAHPTALAPAGIACAHMQRLGSSGWSGVGDGSKIVCLDTLPLPSTTSITPIGSARRPPCVVLSVGSNGDYRFEEAARALMPQCVVHTFDGTRFHPDGSPRFAAPPAWLRPTFHDENLNGRSRLLSHHGPTPYVPLLKMDCEGCEYGSLPPLLDRMCVDVLLIETHGWDRNADRVLLEVLNRTHGIYSIEPNAASYPLVEIALRRRSLTSGACAKSHPRRHEHIRLSHLQGNGSRAMATRIKR